MTLVAVCEVWTEVRKSFSLVVLIARIVSLHTFVFCSSWMIELTTWSKRWRFSSWEPVPSENFRKSISSIFCGIY